MTPCRNMTEICIYSLHPSGTSWKRPHVSSITSSVSDWSISLLINLTRVRAFLFQARCSRRTHHFLPGPPLRISSTANCCLSNVLSEKSWKRHLPPSQLPIAWTYVSPSARLPEKHSWMTTIAGAPGGPAVMIMLA
jgi:hypothetical protein